MFSGRSESNSGLGVLNEGPEVQWTLAFNYHPREMISITHGTPLTPLV